jgi:hypothetical protein
MKYMEVKARIEDFLYPEVTMMVVKTNLAYSKLERNVSVGTVRLTLGHNTRGVGDVGRAVDEQFSSSEPIRPR